MSNSVFAVPQDMSFEQAIALTEHLLNQVEQGVLVDGEVEEAIAALVRSESGARGFFVTYLAGGSSLADHPTPPVIRALQSAPGMVSELLLKNLAMSTAMAITHRRNQKEDLAAGSDRVHHRTQQLIQMTQLPDFPAKAQHLLNSALTGEGEYQSFLDRWGYDAEQRQAIVQILKTVTS